MWKSIGLISIGNLGVYLISFLFLPFITRIYSPETFGKYGEITSIGSIIGICFFAGLERAVPLIREREVNSFIRKMFLVLFVFSTLSIIGLFSYKRYVQNMSHIDVFLILSIGIGVALTNFYSYFIIRTKEFKKGVIFKNLQIIIQSGGQLGFGHLKFLSYLTLVSFEGFSKIIISCIGFLFLIIQRKNSIEESSFKFKNYTAFYTYGLFSTVLLTLSTNLPALLIANLFSAKECGEFILASRLSFIPSVLISTGVGQVFLSELSQNKEDKVFVKKLFFDTVKKLTIISIIIGLFLLIVPYLLPIIFGQAWTNSAKIFYYLIPVIMIQLIVSPISTVATIYHKQYLDLFFSFFRLCLIFISFFIFKDNFILTLTAFSVLATISYFMFGFSCFTLINKITL